MDDVELDYTFIHDKESDFDGMVLTRYYYMGELIWEKHFLVKPSRKIAIMNLRPRLSLGEVHTKVFQLIAAKGEYMEKKYGVRDMSMSGAKIGRPRNDE